MRIAGGRSPGRLCVISGAQNLSGGINSFRPTSSSRIPYPSLRPDRAKLAHSIAPPLQRKPAALGFALGAAFGGLLGGKLQPVRVHGCAWLRRANGTGAVSAAGATLADARKPSPCQGEGAPKGADEGDLLARPPTAEALRTSPIQNPNRFRSCRRGGTCPSRRPLEPHLSPTGSKGALPTGRRTTQRLPETQRQR